MSDSHSTPHIVNASIAVMKQSPSPRLTEDIAATLMTHWRGSYRVSPPARLPKREAQKGAGKLKAIFWTLLFAAFVYVSIKVVPAYVNEYQFEDGIETIARFATMNRQTPEEIRGAVLKEAQKDNLAIGAEDIKVQAVNGNVKINADYSVMIDLGVYQWTLNFHPAVTNNALY